MLGSQLCWSRFRRALRSSSRVYLVILPALGSAVVTAFFRASEARPTLASGIGITSDPRFWWIAGFLAIFLLTLQAVFEYRRNTYDLTWVLKYQERFDGMTKERDSAVRVLLERMGDDLSNLALPDTAWSEVDEVLDFFEDVGFYV